MSEPARFYVGHVSSFKDKSRQLVKCGKRNVAVYFYNNQFFALDNACYHHGGPLLEGDIEDMDGHPCVVCPWHQYRITLDTGEGMYWALQIPASGTLDKNAPREARTKGRKQRVHIVTVEDGKLFVTLDLSGPRLESDTYAEMELANQEKTMVSPISERTSRSTALSKGIHSGMSSGQIFNRNEMWGKLHQGDPESEKRALYCVKIEHVCDDTKELFFNLCQGHLDGPLLPGQFVDLQLPITGSSGRLLVRRWTVMRVNTDGCLFTLIIKAALKSRGGSVWVLENGLRQRFPLLLVGGCFTLTHHMRRLREVGGRIVVLSAGIGVTAPYASLYHYIERSSREGIGGEEEGGGDGAVPKLDVIHLHVERRVSSVTKLEDFVRWHHAAADHFKYLFHCYLTQQQPGSVVDKSLQALTTCGRRPTMEDMRNFFSGFVAVSPVLAFICGPPEFIAAGKSLLLSFGVLGCDMLTDEDDDDTAQGI